MFFLNILSALQILMSCGFFFFLFLFWAFSNFVYRIKKAFSYFENDIDTLHFAYSWLHFFEEQFSISFKLLYLHEV